MLKYAGVSNHVIVAHRQLLLLWCLLRVRFLLLLLLLFHSQLLLLWLLPWVLLLLLRSQLLLLLCLLLRMQFLLKLVVCYSHLPFAVSTRFLECARATGGSHEST